MSHTSRNRHRESAFPNVSADMDNPMKYKERLDNVLSDVSPSRRELIAVLSHNMGIVASKAESQLSVFDDDIVIGEIDQRTLKELGIINDVPRGLANESGFSGGEITRFGHYAVKRVRLDESALKSGTFVIELPFQQTQRP